MKWSCGLRGDSEVRSRQPGAWSQEFVGVCRGFDTLIPSSLFFRSFFLSFSEYYGAPTVCQGLVCQALWWSPLPSHSWEEDLTAVCLKAGVC